MLRTAHLRVARPTDHLTEIIGFYRDGLGFELIGSFQDHDGFDGVMLGHSQLSYHLEFTTQPGHPAGRAPNKESLLVFYLPIKEDWNDAVDRMISQGYEPVASLNPYWDVKGRTFEDPDGYRIVLQNASWPVNND